MTHAVACKLATSDDGRTGLDLSRDHSHRHVVVAAWRKERARAREMDKAAGKQRETTWRRGRLWLSSSLSSCVFAGCP